MTGPASGTRQKSLNPALRVPMAIAVSALANIVFATWTTVESTNLQQQLQTINECLLKGSELRYQLLSDDITKDDTPNPRVARQILEEDRALLIRLRDFAQLDRVRKMCEEAHMGFSRSRTSSAAIGLSSSLTRVLTAVTSVQESLTDGLRQLHYFQYGAATAMMLIVAGLVAACTKAITSESDTLAKVEEGLKSVCSGKSYSSKSAPVALATSLAQLSSMMSEIRRNEQAVINNALDVICTIDDANRFAMVNPSSVRVLGYTPEEIIGKRVQDFVADAKDDNIGMLVGTSKSMARVSMEMQWRKKDGTVVSLLWSAYWSSGSETLFCVVHDITDRKKAEQILKESESRLRAILQGMPVAVLVENNGIIEYANKHALTLSGYSAQELPGELLSILSPIGSKTVQSCLDNKVEGAEVSLIRRNGENFQAELYSSVLSPDGDDPRRLVMFVDVTERHRAEQLKREFLAMAGHELRTPLTSIRVTLRSMADGVYGNLSERGSDMLERCDGELIRLVSLIGDMLDAERMRSGKLHLSKTEVSTTALIDAAIAAVKPVAAQREIDLISRYEEMQVHADGAKIIQVLINLLSNAIKFSPAQSQITITGKSLGDRIRLDVKDRGRGIPAGYEKVIFEQFSQVEHADAKRGRGAGLGLSICKSIVEAHGGVIGVDSQFGRGSVFWLEIPKTSSIAAQDDDDDDLEEEEKQEEKQEKNQDEKQERLQATDLSEAPITFEANNGADEHEPGAFIAINGQEESVPIVEKKSN